MIRTHPVSGRRSLFVNEGFTSKINELSDTESAAILKFLFAHATRPEFTIRWRWQQDDIAFWDNRVTQHYAVDDYRPARRVMQRATVLGMCRSSNEARFPHCLNWPFAASPLPQVQHRSQTLCTTGTLWERACPRKRQSRRRIIRRQSLIQRSKASPTD